MDDDDSQDELINRNTSSSKGRRAPLWAISDDSDDAEEESVEGESDSGEEEEGGHLDGDEDEEEEGSEEDDDEEEEDEAKAEDGALGGTSADLAGMSSDEDSEKCPICLNSFSSQPVATPENCEHYFCLDCILEWAKNANSCPVDRIAFNNIYLRKCYAGKVKKVITVQKPVKEGQEETVDLDLEQTNCEVCGGSDREDRLLLCDGCDAGYHMECLMPPLDAVPVEEWFCPECEANNRNSRTSVEEVSDTESLPSTARPATSRSQHAPGPTRAIARTQQSERVRANVNRHRITQARTSQLAPTYLIQSTWLDETINAVVAGLNTSVYVRDFTPRAPSSRRRKTKKRRTATRRTTSSTGKNGKVVRKGAKGKRRRVKRRKTRKQLVLKKTATPRSRIANNLGIAKDKKGSSLPTVYRPAEHTLSGMRADIGAASLSIYGDPFDLDPFVDHEEEQQAHVTSLLEAKRRGISRSAMRSHQPVARPVTTSLYRRGADLPQPPAVAEAAPVPDLLGSILSGQSMLLMDSSDVVINRDGSLKATKPVIPSVSKPDRRNSTSGDSSTPVMSPTHGVVDVSPHYSGELSGTSHNSTSRPFPQSASHLAANMPSSASHIQPSPRSDLPPRGAPGLQPPRPVRSTHSLGQRGTSGVRSPSPFSPVHPSSNSSSKNKGTALSHLQPKKAPTKPMWVDVSVLPRIPKIKRESSGITSDESNSGNSSSSTSSSNGYRLPGMNSFAGNQGRQQSVDRQNGRNDGQSQRQSSEAAGPSSSSSSSSSSSAFSSSFSTSSSSTSSPADQLHYSSASSSSSAVSFRINSSGNSWHSRRLNLTSSSSTPGEVQQSYKKKEDDVRKRQLHRDKQKLLASRTLASKEDDDNNIYDPFNPTLSDSSGSDDDDDDDVESKCNSRHTAREEKPRSRNQERLVRSSQDLVPVKTEIAETEALEEGSRRDRLQETVSQEVRSLEKHIKVEKEESRVTHTETVKHKVLLDTEKKKAVEEAEKASGCAKRLSSETADTTASVHHSPHLLKTERGTPHEGILQSVAAPSSAPSNNRNNSSVSSSAPDKNEQKQAKIKSDFKSRSKSPPRDSSRKGKTSQGTKEGCSSSSETDRGRRGEYHSSGQGGEHKEKEDRERNSKRSRSRERRRRRARSTSASSLSSSPDRSGRKRRKSRSRSKDRRRSRSGSSSGSREPSWKKKQKQSYGKDRNSERGRTSRDKRRGRSPSKSRSKSRSTSRSKENKRCRSRSKSRSRSRSRSRERRKDHRQPHQSSLPSREKAASRSKDEGRRRSRSSSRERRRQEGSSSKSSQKPSKASDSCISSHKDTKHLQAKAKEKDTARCPKEVTVATVTKQESPPRPVAAEVKKEDKDVPIENKSTTTELANKLKPVKVKKEKRPSLDMFEDSIVTKPIKKEDCGHQDATVLQGTDWQEQPIKTEPCDIPIVKSEPGSPELFPLPPVTLGSTPTLPATIDSLHEAAPQSPSPPEQPSTVEMTVPVKQEVHQPSDSDDDFNVDMMLDSLDFVKSKGTEKSDALVKEEKEVVEEKNEAEQPSAVMGVKSKAQVKRVTWNIQEPEGPQPDKSASKVALYKLRLKQEGVRRPFLAAQTSSQDITGSDSSKKAVPDPMSSSSSQSDGAHPEGSSTTGQEEGDEGDLSRKDKYLKKLHMQERAIEEVKLAIKPFYQKRDINKDEYKEILRKAVQKVCHSKSGEINPVKVGNLVKAYVDKYKHARKHRKGEDSGKTQEVHTEAVGPSDCM